MPENRGYRPKQKMLEIIIIPIFILFLSVSLGFCQEYGAASDFVLKDLGGNKVKLSDFKYKQPVLLFFWTTWCPFCRKELPQLNKMYPEFKKDGVEVLIIDVQESKEKVENFLKKIRLNISVLLDTDASVASMYNILGVPTYIFMDKKGNIVFKGNSFPQGKYKKLIQK